MIQPVTLALAGRRQRSREEGMTAVLTTESLLIGESLVEGAGGSGGVSGTCRLRRGTQRRRKEWWPRLEGDLLEKEGAAGPAQTAFTVEGFGFRVSGRVEG